eukprot:SM000313S11970  [mRNA]  locus=s313:16532:18848:- [translate_table: standard]
MPSTTCPGSLPVDWTTEFYEDLQNKIGGGKPKMRWFFGEHGWPTSTIFPSGPQSDEEKTKLIDTLQDWKTTRYQEIIASGGGLKVAVCSAATKSSVIFCLESLLGQDRFQRLDCFLAGDDVDKKKPDPTIYRTAAERLQIDPDHCLVVEDSLIGLQLFDKAGGAAEWVFFVTAQAANGAGMRCIITYTGSTQNQDFSSAAAVYPDLEHTTLVDLQQDMFVVAA